MLWYIDIEQKNTNENSKREDFDLGSVLTLLLVQIFYLK